MRKSYLSLTLIILLLLSAGCGPNQSKAARAYAEIQTNLEGASDIVHILNKGGQLSNKSALSILTKIEVVGGLADKFGVRARELGAITPANKGELLQLIGTISGDLSELAQDGTLEFKTPEAKAKFVAAIALIQTSVTIVASFINNIKEPVPLAAGTFKEQ